jgi:Type II secretion system (T2SS), protein E, N-terminal domain
MTPRELPEYLRPVPGPGEGSSSAAAAEVEQPQEEHSGLIAPSRRGHSGAFVTDAIVDLGYATREQVEQAIASARTAGRTPEAILIEHALIDTEQLSRATAERYGLDYVDLAIFKVDMAAANLISVKSARRHQAVPISFIDWRWRTPPTCWRSTTSRWRPG